MPHRRRDSSPQTRAVLHALQERPGWSHGYELARATGLKSGTLYPILVRLASHGLLEATWEASPLAGRPPRHLYRLTASGLALASTVSVDRRSAPGRAIADPERS